MLVRVDPELCKGCGRCAKECPLEAISIVDKKAVITEKCVVCGVCSKVCKYNAVLREESSVTGVIKCTSCPVQCEVKPGFTGACGRYVNTGEKLERNRSLWLL